MTWTIILGSLALLLGCAAVSFLITVGRQRKRGSA